LPLKSVFCNERRHKRQERTTTLKRRYMIIEAAKVLGVGTDALRKRVARGTYTRTTALLAAICTALLTLIAVNPAFGVLVGSRFQAENMTESSASISVVPDPDGTGPAGPNLKWASGAGVADRASQPISVPTGSPVDQIQLFTRQASGGTAVFAIYVDGTAAANKVGTFSPPAGGPSKWGISTVSLSTVIQPRPEGHTLYIGPDATFSNNAFIDWFELHSTTTDAPAAPTITGGPANGAVDTDGSFSYDFTGAESGGSFQCSLDTGTPNYSKAVVNEIGAPLRCLLLCIAP
jgi:hypothetical protein